jgi:23S rRNA pseudouridine1911/1915/1917 synthase
MNGLYGSFTGVASKDSTTALEGQKASPANAVPCSIVHIDEDLVVLNKPAGLSLATPRSDTRAAVRRLLDSLPAGVRDKYALSESRLWLVHRLDVGTSGLVLLGRTSDAHSRLARALSEGRLAKVYLALVWGHLRPREGCLEWRIGPDRRDRRRMRVDPAGRPAKSRYRTLAARPHVSLLELRPETGRTHQLRVHLARAGHWIVGDDLYGGPRHRGVRDPRLRELLTPTHPLLHAWRLSLPRLTAGSATEFEAPLPEDFGRIIRELGIAEGVLR